MTAVMSVANKWKGGKGPAIYNENKGKCPSQDVFLIFYFFSVRSTHNEAGSDHRANYRIYSNKRTSLITNEPLTLEGYN
jgi:hypothetical protein